MLGTTTNGFQNLNMTRSMHVRIPSFSDTDHIVMDIMAVECRCRLKTNI